MDWCVMKAIDNLRFSQQRRGGEGFSIVEVVVSAVILLAAVTGSIILYNLTARNTTLAGNQQDELAAVSADMAQVFRVNDQFICTTTTNCGCIGGSCVTSGSYPGENSYIPGGYILDSAVSAGIESLCNTGFGTRLATTINGLALPTKAASLGITRNAIANTSGSPHLYTVTWSSSRGSQLRQMTLYPTIAAWCP